jgi:hypothetical protein
MKSLYLLLLTTSFLLLSACEAFEPRTNDYTNLEIIVIDEWAIQGPSTISFSARKGTAAEPGAEFLFYTRFEEGTTYTWTVSLGEQDISATAIQGIEGGEGTAGNDKTRSRVRIKFMPDEVGVAVITVSAPGYKDGSKEVILDEQLPSRTLDGE